MASPGLDKEFRALYAEMVDAWVLAPEPEGVYLPEVDLAALAGVAVVGVAHGWITRLVRTGEAALLLDECNYAEEASPLVRSALEHAIGLWWLVNDRGDAFQSLARARAGQMQRLKDAQDQGWGVGDEKAEALLQAAIDIETDEASKRADHLLAVAHQAAEYGLGEIYQAWLVESWTSHASIASARAYYIEHADDGDVGVIELLQVPDSSSREVAAAVVIALHTGLSAYNRLLAGEPLT